MGREDKTRESVYSFSYPLCVVFMLSRCSSGLADEDELETLSNGFPLFDLCSLEFEFSCDSAGDGISVLKYVFASEEYNEFVGSPFSDAFGIFLDGENIATLEDNSPVSINSINCGNPFEPDSDSPSCSSFVNNDWSTGGPYYKTEADGFTRVLTSGVSTRQGGTHTMKLAVADAADSLFDTNVLFEEGSISCKSTEQACDNRDIAYALWNTDLDHVIGLLPSVIDLCEYGGAGLNIEALSAPFCTEKIRMRLVNASNTDEMFVKKVESLPPYSLGGDDEGPPLDSRPVEQLQIPGDYVLETKTLPGKKKEPFYFTVKACEL